jgi:hypothetical protein
VYTSVVMVVYETSVVSQVEVGVTVGVGREVKEFV